jgi:hypothetical protein
MLQREDSENLAVLLQIEFLEVFLERSKSKSEEIILITKMDYITACNDILHWIYFPMRK